MRAGLSLIVLIELVLFCSSSGSHNDEKCFGYEFENNQRPRTVTVATTPDFGLLITRIGNGVPFGFDIDLMNLISFITRIKFVYEYTDFASTISIVANNTNTISITAAFITPARMALVDFAQFFKSGSAFLVRSTYSGTVNTLADLCGKRVVVQTGTLQYGDVQTQNGLCGANPIQIVVVATFRECVSLVANGTVDVSVNQQALLVGYVQASNNQLQIVGTIYNILPIGIYCNKNNRPLCCELVEAINILIRDGTYGDLLKRYAFSFKNNGICPSRININGTICERSCAPRANSCAKKLS